MKNRKRKIPIQIYVNENELIIINERVRLSGKRSKSEYLRDLLLDAPSTRSTWANFTNATNPSGASRAV